MIATVEATGTLEGITTVEVGTQVSGTLKTLGADFIQGCVEDGDRELDPWCSNGSAQEQHVAQSS